MPGHGASATKRTNENKESLMNEPRRQVSSPEPEHLLVLCLAITGALLLLGNVPALF